MAQLPTLDLLRQLSDRAVLDQLLTHDRLTRAEIAARTALSKPTVSESMRRLAGAGLAVDTGERSSGRGRSGSYFAVPDNLGVALTLEARAGIVRIDMVDLTGRTVLTRQRTVGTPVRAARLARALRAEVTAALTTAPGPVRATSVSIADPVDRSSGRTVQLPDVPFLVGDLDIRTTLDGIDVGEVHVDNDVNWAAVAEHREGAARDLDDFIHVHLGEGIGAAVVLDGHVRRGHRGLAGELMQVPVDGAPTLVRRLMALGLTRTGSSVIDTAAVITLFAATTRTAVRCQDDVVGALAHALGAATALFDPGTVILGGTWHTAGDLVPRLADRLADSPVPTTLQLAEVADPSVRGATLDALHRGRASLVEPTPDDSEPPTPKR